ncbi:MAG: transcription antitermination factor NusB [Clostridiales bacterium]|nr:transcription antitermination factor NusB [Clostridiales bacterium]
MSRKIAREVLMKLLYEKDIAGEYHQESLQSLIEEFKLNERDENYINQILSSMGSQQPAIDIFIEKYAKSWTMERMAKIDLAILRLSMYELLYRKDIPIGVSINEAVELAKKFGNEKSGAFINGILGNFTRSESLIDNEDGHFE